MNGRAPYSGFAPGKLLLFGEHAAVFGYPAVGVSLDRGLRISVTPADGISIRLARPAGGDIATGLSAFAAFVADTLGSPADDGPVSPAGGAITVDSDLPISSGFGSSAALCTAIAEWSLPDPQVSGHDRGAVWRRAHRLEAFFHGHAERDRHRPVQSRRRAHVSLQHAGGSSRERRVVRGPAGAGGRRNPPGTVDARSGRRGAVPPLHRAVHRPPHPRPAWSARRRRDRRTGDGAEPRRRPGPTGRRCTPPAP